MLFSLVQCTLAALLFGCGFSATTTKNKGYGPDTVINFSGYIDVHNKERHLFYWFFESRKDPTNDPFIIWLTGGPGCSSMLALMVENGPYHVLDNETLEINPYSWNTQANIMWIDQPAGTGYSYDDAASDGVYTEDEVADDLYEFIQSFMTTNSKYSNLDFYVTGESYAGHYVPHFSKKIFDMNNNLPNGNIKINLKGLAIGDGLVDPYLQYDEYAPYAKDYNLINETSYNIMMDLLPLCENNIYKCEINDSYKACQEAYGICYVGEWEPVLITGINPLDIRRKCQQGATRACYNFDNIDTFFRTPSVIEALNASNTYEWKECDPIVQTRMVLAGDWMKNYNNDIPPMLEDGIQVLVYHGEYDFICNWYGGYNWVKNLNWKYNTEWNNAANMTWLVDGNIAGYNITSHGLTFLKVLNAGHMVPMDQPINALAMIEQFTKGGGF